MRTWVIRFSDEALKRMKQFDRYTVRLIDSWIAKHLEHCENPRSLGKGLVGNKSGQWRYRIGDYRLFCEIQDDVLLILVIKVGHRKNAYR